MNRNNNQSLEKESIDSNKNRREPNRPQKVKDTSSGENSELYYIDPNEEPNYHAVETKGRAAQQSRSPISGVQQASSTLKQERSTIKLSTATIEVPLPKRLDKERSPKNINMGETRQEKEYNIQTLNAKRGLNQRDMLYQTFTNKNAIDEMNISGFVRGHQGGGQPESKTIEQSSSMIQTGTMHRRNPSDSYQGREEDDSRFSNLKHQMDRNAPNQLEDIIRTQEAQRRDTYTNSEIKKMVKKMTKVYDPNSGKDGALISTTQTIIPSVNNPEMFKDRYQVLQKMNRLSTILLSTKNKGADPVQEYEAERKTFDRNTLTRGKLAEGNKDNVKITRTAKQKFLFISLAMISSKGPNCEDRIILRKFRFDKGGVVDLAQDVSKSKTKYSVKKMTRKKPPVGTSVQRANPKYRDKAAKVVQGWWRELRDRYKRVYNKIILIQSAWRGRWIRKYMYDIIYLSFLYQSFCSNIQKVLVNYVRPYVFNLFTADRKNAMDALYDLFSKDMKYRAIKIKPFWQNWRAVVGKYNHRHLKSRNLVDIRRNGEEKLLTLQKAFNKYRLLSNLLKYMKKSTDEEGQKRKFFGLINIMQGAEKLSKRKGLQTVKPHLDKYLDNQLKSKAVRLLLHTNPKLQRIIMRNSFGKWKDQLRRLQRREFHHKVFWDKVGSCKSHFGKNVLRRYFMRWYRLLPKNTDINLFNGSEVLQKAVWRRTYKDPLKALISKEDYLATKDSLLRVLGVKQRYIRQHWRDYFFKWKSQAQRSKDKEIRDRMYISLLSTLFLKRRRRILSNRLSHWRKVPKIDMEAIFTRFRQMIAFTQVVADKALLPMKKDFFKAMKGTTHPRLYKSAIQTLFEQYVNKDRTWKRYAMNRWREQCHKGEIYDLKLRLLRFFVLDNHHKNKKNSKANRWNKWKAVVADAKKHELHQLDDQLLELLLKKRFGTKMIMNIRSHFVKENTQNALRGAWMLYRNKIHLTKEKDDKATAEALKHMKMHNTVTNAPPLLDELQRKAMTSRRTKALRSMPRKYSKGQKAYLLRYFINWKNITNALIQKENIDKIRRGLLKRFCMRFDKEMLSRSFNTWKVAGLAKRSNYPLIVGTEKLKHLLISPGWNLFKKKVSMMNLTIPEGMSLQSALLHGKRGVGKSICLRNINMRPFFNRFRKNANALKNRELKHHIFNKTILPNMKNQSRLVLRRGFTNWRDRADYLKNLELQRSLYMKLMEKFYSNGSKFGLNRAFKRWKQNYLSFLKRLEDTHSACYKLRKVSTVEPMNQFRKAIMYQTKYQQARTRLVNALRGNDRNNLAFCFNKWRKVVQREREFELKTMLLKQVMKHQDIKSDDYKKNQLHSALLKWRMKTAPNFLYKQFSNLVQGTDILSKAMRGPFNLEILNRIGNISGDTLRKSVISRLIRKIDPAFDRKLIRRAFANWRNKLPDTLSQREKLKRLLETYLLSPIIHTKMIHSPVEDLVEAMRAYVQLREQKAKSIQDFCRGILNIKRQLGLLKRSLLIKNRISSLYEIELNRLPSALSRYRRNIKLVASNDNAVVIQHFLKSRMPNKLNRQQQAVKGAEIIRKHLLNRVLSRMDYRARQNVLMLLCRKVLGNKSNAAKKLLRDRLNCWRSKIPHMRRDRAATMIENNYLNLKSRRKVQLYKLRNSKVKGLLYLLFDKELGMKWTYFSKWLNEAQRRSCVNNARIIQNYLRQKLENFKGKQAKRRLQDMFIKFFVKNIKDLITYAGRIKSNRGEVLYRTLEDIYIRKPYYTLMNAMKWIGRIQILKSVQPKIARALRSYFVPHYFKVWKANTIGLRDKMSRYIQKWIRERLAAQRARRQLMKQQLLMKFLMKLTQDEDLLLSTAFTLWLKKSQLTNLNDKALTIQRVWKGKAGRRNADKELNKNKLRGLLQRGFFSQITVTLKNSHTFVNRLLKGLKSIERFDKRYATNNLIDYANDVLRNKYLLLLTGKKAFKDNLSHLRYGFDNWRTICGKLNKAALKIQTNVRSLRSRNLRGRLGKKKAHLLSLMLSYSKTDADKLKSAFAKWIHQANLLKCQENSKIIQAFLRPRFAKLSNTRFVSFFLSTGPKLAKHRLNNFGKAKAFKDIVHRVSFGQFFTRLSNKTRGDQLKLFLAKRFGIMDKDLERLLKKKYFGDWRKNARGLKEKMLQGVVLIQNNVRQLLAKRFLDKLRAKRARLLRVLTKLTNDSALLKRLNFDLWRTNARAITLSEATRVIHEYIDSILKKIKRRLDAERMKRLNEGFEKLCSLSFPKRIAFGQIRSESNRKVFSTVVDSLEKKRIDHLTTSYRAIRQREIDNLLNRLLKIPSKCRERILKKWLPIWRDNANKMAKLRSTQMIQKNYRIYSTNKRWNSILNKMRPIMSELFDKYANIMKHYFNKWNGNVKRMGMLKAGNKINRFTKDKLALSKARKSWNKFSDGLLILSRNYGALNLMKRLKLFMALQRLFKPIDHRIKRDGYDQLLSQLNLIRLMNLLRLILTNFDRRKEILALLSAFNRWNTTARKLALRDQALAKAVEAMDNRYKCISTDAINCACLIKRLFRTINEIRAQEFIRKLKDNLDYNNKIRRLRDLLCSGRDDCRANNKTTAVQKVYTSYIYVILSKMYNLLSQVINRHKKPAYDSLIARMYLLLSYSTAQTYQLPKTTLNEPTKVPLTFKSRVANPKKKILESTKESAVYFRLSPYLVDYLYKKYDANKLWAFTKLKGQTIDSRFCSLYKSHSNKSLKAPKKELYDILKARSDYLDSLGPLQAKLFMLFRRAMIRKITQFLVLPSHLYRLLYLVKISVMHKEVKEKRFGREVIRKWRFMAFVKKMAKKKLELMYQNLHMNYIQTTNLVFGETENANMSLVKEFENLGENMGMFVNESIEQQSHSDKITTKAISRQELFDPELMTKTKHSEIYEEEYSEEIGDYKKQK